MLTLSEFNFRIDMLRSKLLQISSLAKEIKLSHILLVSLYQEDEIKPQSLHFGSVLLQIRSQRSLTREVISRWTKSTISLFSPVSQSMVANSDSQLGVFNMWQAQRHFWSCQHRGLSNLLRNQMQQINIFHSLASGACACQLREGAVLHSAGGGDGREIAAEQITHISHWSRKTGNSREHFKILRGSD